MMLTVTLDPQLSGSDRLAAWQDVMSPTGEVHVADPGALVGTLQSKEVGNLRTIRITASTFRLVRDRDRAAAVSREHVLVNLVEAGSFEGRLAGRKLVAGPGDLVLSRLGNLMNVTLVDADWLALVVPQRLVERQMHWDSRLDGSVHKAGTVAAAMVGGLVRALCALPSQLPPGEAARATSSALATLAACLSEASAPGRTGAGRENGKEVTVREVQRFITRRLSHPALGVELIRQEFGLSRSALYRVMAAGTGEIAAAIRTMRLQAIAQEIASPLGKTRSLADIAARHGIADERTFRRAFAREFGFAPSVLRDGSMAGPLPQSPGRKLQRWFSES